MKSTITICFSLLLLLASCQKEAVQLIEPIVTQQVVATGSKIVYLDYFLQEVPVNAKSKLVITTTLSKPTPKEIKVNYVVYLNGVFTQVKVVVPAGRTNFIFETLPYNTTVPFVINDVLVTSDNDGWVFRIPKP